ncbi:MAG: DUF971 domain-containing protein [Planctomycetota bacterium]
MPSSPDSEPHPRALDLDRRRGLSVTWADGGTAFFPIAYLRRMSPSADMKQLREDMRTNPLTVLPAERGSADGSGDLTATEASLVGNYALRITFSDGHRTGIYSWDYLRSIEPDADRDAT